MARYRHLPLWREANRLLLVLEQSVRQFPRYIDSGCATCWMLRLRWQPAHDTAPLTVPAFN